MKIDLYNIFKSNGLSLPFSPGFAEIDVFKALIRIILACDAVHDFLGDRAFDGATQVEQKKFFLRTTMYYLIKDLNNINPGMKAECDKQLNNSGVFKVKRKLTYENPEASDSFIRGDASAKEVVSAILSIMKLKKISLSSVSEGDCADDASFFRMLDILTRIQESITKQPIINPSYNLKIDATSNPMNLLPIYSGVLANYRKFKSECPNVPNIRLIEDLSTFYDPSNTDQLTKFFNDQGLTLKSNDSILNYDIRIGDSPIINCTLQLFGSQGNETVKLSINKYFNQTFAQTPISRTNDSVGRQKNNSVGSLALEMISKYNPSTAAEKADGGPVMQKLYNLSMFKTMGDFLQLMTFLCLENKCEDFRGINPYLVNSITAFISFDIICYEMGSIFSRFVVGETGDKGSNSLATGMSIYLREDMVGALTLTGYSKKAYNVESKKRMRRDAEAETAYSLLDMRRTGFGRKTNKLNSMSNEELKNKLKSVGINVTKLSSKGKRLNLTRKEMEKKANLFKNLQLRAKKIGIKLMYKSKRRGYIYKSYTRLMNELERIKTKYISKFG